MRNRRFLTSLILIVCFAMVLLSCVACGNTNLSTDVSGNKTTFKKSFYEGFSTLLNGGTKQDSELAQTEVWVTVVLSGRSLADEYAAAGFFSLSEYIRSDAGRASVAEKQELQNSVMNKILAMEIQAEFKQSFTTLFNGFSAKLKASDIKTVEAIANVEEVIVSELYAVPTSASVGEIGKTIGSNGILTNETEYQGEGMVIAIVDTGLDVDHPAFNTYPTVTAINEADVKELFANLYINTSLGMSYVVDQLYINAKVPFGFNYADRNTAILGGFMDVNFYGGEHGTHVAGIAAGNDDTIQGAAPEAQLAIMKVFGENVGGAYTNDILAALCDCAALGVDVINMSLGSGAGLPEELGYGNEYLNTVYETIDRLGINLVVAAGNDESSSVYANNQMGNKTANPDNGIVGSPASYSAAVSVASAAGGALSYFNIDGERVIYRPAVDMDDNEFPFISVLEKAVGGNTAEFVFIDGVGSEMDYEDLDVTGKIVIVWRGDLSFEEKQEIAAAHGAIACFIINYESGNIVAMMESCKIPTATISIDYADVIYASEDRMIEFSEKYVYIDMSYFSSIGPLADLQLGVDITAPGDGIYSSVPTNYWYADLYEYMRGTSMASPNMAGITAALRQYVKATHPEFTNQQVQDRVWKLAMSTANVMIDDNFNPVTPRKQGAGMVDISKATATKGFIEVIGSDRVKLELGDDVERAGVYTLNFDVVNEADYELVYALDFKVFTETAVDGYIAQMAYMFNDYDVRVTVKNGEYENGQLIVEAGKTASVKAVITLSEEEKAYMDETFENGIYVEGFVMLESENDVDLSIPFLAFYGNWSEAAVLDATNFDEGNIVLFGNQLWGQYVVDDGLFYFLYDYVLGEYGLFTLPDGYENPEGSPDKIAISREYGLNTMIISALRAIKELRITVSDPITGVEYFIISDSGLPKTYVDENSGQYTVLQAEVGITPEDYNFYNNQSVVVKYEALGYGRNAEWQSIEFPMFIDFEAPTLENVEVVERDGRTILLMDVYDNHYLMNMGILSYDENGYYGAYNYAIPVYDFVKGQTNKVELDITDYFKYLNGNNLAIEFADYAMNFVTYDIYLGDETEANVNAAYNVSSVYGNKDEVYTTTSYIYNDDAVVNSDDDEEEFVIEDGVLVAYNGKGGEVIVPDGVTEIGSDVFRKNRTITKVTLPEGVITIGDGAFRFSSVTEVILPTTVEAINDNAFLATFELRKINLEDTAVNYIGWNAFSHSGLEELIIPKNGDVLSLDYEAIGYMTNLKRLVIYANIEYVTGFMGCFNVEEILIYGNIGRFLESAFSANTLCKRIEFFGNIEEFGSEEIWDIDETGYPMGELTSNFCSYDSLEEVIFHGDVGSFGGYSFNSCNKLSRVVFEGSVGSFGDYVFQYCPKLTHFEAPESNTNFYYDAENQMLYSADKTEYFVPGCWDYDGVFEIPETVTTLKRLSHAGYVCKGVDITIVKTETSISTQISISCGTSNGMDEGIRMYNLTGIVIPAKFTTIPAWFVFAHPNLETIEFKGEVEEIGFRAFEDAAISEVVLPESLRVLGQKAFSNCRNATRFVANEGLEVMGENNYLGGDFEGWVSIKEITIPDVVEGLRYTVFENCTSLERVYLPDHIRFSGNGTFSGCINLVEIVTEAEINYVGWNMFENCYKLPYVNLSDDLDEINDYAFNNCYALNIRIPENVSYIGTSAFNNCISMEYIDISEYITDIDLSEVFAGCTGVKAYNISDANFNYRSLDGVVYSKDMSELVIYPSAKEAVDFTVYEYTTAIGQGAFANTKNIKSVRGVNVEEIDSYAFDGSSIEAFIGSNITSISDFAFRNAVNFREIDYTNASYIGDHALRNTAISEIILTGKNEYVGGFAFADCRYLTKVVLEADTCLFDYVSVFYNDDIEEMVIDNNNRYFKMDDNGSVFSKDGSIIYKYAAPGEEVVISEGVIFVAASAFKDNTEIKKVTFPTTMQAIGADAFFGCTSLEVLEFKSEKAPALFGEYDENARYPYRNFVRSIEEGALDIELIAPDNATYKTFIWTMYFGL